MTSDDQPVQSWIYNAGTARPKPADPFGFNVYLIDKEETDVMKFADIVSKNAMLSNYSDMAELQLGKNDANILISLYALGKTLPRNNNYLDSIFNVLYYQWNAEITLNRAKGGKERDYAASVGTTYNPQAQAMPAYFATMPPQMMVPQMTTEQQQQQQGGGNPVSNFLNRIRGK
jgi:hypothetical protein